LKEAHQRGVDLGLNDDEVAFYNALAANNSAIEVMGKDNLKVIATELVTQLQECHHRLDLARKRPRENQGFGQTHPQKTRLPTRFARRSDQACLATSRTSLRRVGSVNLPDER
jgi:hypothetical protein